MSTWNSPPQIPAFKAPPFGADPETIQKTLISYLKDLANVVSQLKNDLEFMINGNLDVNNIRANGIKANNIDVDKLSAISADLGTITAGIIRGIEIYGAYIATAEGTYPRAEMSNTGNLFGAYSTSNRYARIESNPNALGAPMLNLGFDGANTFIYQVGNTCFILGQGASQISIGGSSTSISGPFNLSGHVNMGFLSVPGATDPDEAVTYLNVLISYLSLMGILA